jgi:hypothetical protein
MAPTPMTAANFPLWTHYPEDQMHMIESKKVMILARRLIFRHIAAR